MVRSDAGRPCFSFGYADEASEAGRASKRHGNSFRGSGIAAQAPDRPGAARSRAHRNRVAAGAGGAATCLGGGAGTGRSTHRPRHRSRDAAGSTATAECRGRTKPRHRLGQRSDSVTGRWVSGCWRPAALAERSSSTSSPTTEDGTTESDSMALAFDRVAARLTHAEHTLAQFEPLPDSEERLVVSSHDIERIESPKRARISVLFEDVDRRVPKRAPAKNRGEGTALLFAPAPDAAGPRPTTHVAER